MARKGTFSPSLVSLTWADATSEQIFTDELVDDPSSPSSYDPLSDDLFIQQLRHRGTSSTSKLRRRVRDESTDYDADDEDVILAVKSLIPWL